MKIAIPTDDGFTIVPHLLSTKGFLISTIEAGQIKEQILRINIRNGTDNPKGIRDQNLADCETVIISRSDILGNNLPFGDKKEIFETDEMLITKILLEYLQFEIHRDSDTCCCP